MLCCANGLRDSRRARARAEPIKSKLVARKGGKAVAMACGQEVWACALLCRRWWLRFGMRTRLTLRLCGVVVCLDVPWPGLALACSSRICVARQGCLLHTMQTGRGTVEYGTRLDMCMPPSQPVHSSSLSGASTGYGSNCQDVRSTQRCRNVGSRSIGGASPHFARGRSQEGPVQVPNRLADSSPAGVPFCPGLPGTSAPSAGQAPSCFGSSQCLSPNIF